MTEVYEPKIMTQIFIVIFFLSFFVFLVRKVIKGSIDLFDLFFLGLLGVIPVVFVIFPQLTSYFTALIGVKYPFLILFGGLHFVMFIYITYLSSRINKLRRNGVKIAQKLALLEEKMQREP